MLYEINRRTLTLPRWVFPLQNHHPLPETVDSPIPETLGNETQVGGFGDCQGDLILDNS